MGRNLRASFMIAASKAATSKQFLDARCSKKDFLESCIGPSDPADIVGARIIEYFCLDDGVYNNFQPGIKIALEFLDATLGTSANRESRRQGLVDLKSLLDAGTDFDELLQWVRSNYG